MAAKPEPRTCDLLHEIAEDFADEPDVAIGTMFRRPGLRVGGKVFAFLGFDGELIVKLPADKGAELVDAGIAERVTMGERTMREWAQLPATDENAATVTRWRDIAREAHRYVDALRKG